MRRTGVVWLVVLVSTLFTCRAFAQELNVKVYAFLGPECPISQQCTRELNELAARYGSVHFAGVVPGDYYSAAEVDEFKARYKITFPVKADREYEITGRLGALITPQVVVVGGHDSVLYSGAIDNSYIALGRKNRGATVRYLANALAEIEAGARVTVVSTTPVGCRIEGLNKVGYAK